MLKTGTLAKVSPPLREKVDNDALWQAVIDGKIDVIGSDTGGHMIAKKEPRFGDAFKAPGGIAPRWCSARPPPAMPASYTGPT